MHLVTFKKFIALAAIAAVVAMPSGLNAQEKADDVIVDVVETQISAEKVVLDESGQLKGKVFVLKNDEKEPVNAKVSLTSAGLIVDSVEADENGIFSFPSVEPGNYEMFATAENLVSASAVEVYPYAEGQVSSCNLQMNYTDASAQPIVSDMGYYNSTPVQSYETVYDSYGSVPAASFGGGCNSCSSGGFARGGFSGGGRLGRGGRIGAIGLFGLLGLIDDSSPDGPNGN